MNSTTWEEVGVADTVAHFDWDGNLLDSFATTPLIELAKEANNLLCAGTLSSDGKAEAPELVVFDLNHPDTLTNARRSRSQRCHTCETGGGLLSPVWVRKVSEPDHLRSQVPDF